MTEKESLEQKLEELGQEIGSDDSLVEHVMSRIDAKPVGESSKIDKLKNKLIISRFITNRFTKFAAAAAVIIIAIILGVYHVNLSSPAYGIMDVPAILKETRTIHIKGWQCADVQPSQNDPNVVQPGQKEIRRLWEYWVDMKTAKMKYTQPGYVVIKGNKVRVPVYTRVYDGKFIMTVDDETKRVLFRRLSPYQQLLKKRKIFFDILQTTLFEVDSTRAFNKTGKERIDGEIFDIWQAELSPPSWEGRQLTIKTWVSPTTGHLGRVEFWHKRPDTSWYQAAEFNQIEYNVPIPNGIFTTEAPPGYTLDNTKETAYVSPLYQWSDRIGGKTGQHIASYACFTLSDGTVILAWSCTTEYPYTKSESDGYQEAIFRELTVGGELPKLPVEFYTVSPTGEDPGVKYYGRHMTYTWKENTFYEWGLYVPEKKLDKYYGQLDYNLHYRCNREDLNRNGASTLGETGDIQIETESDFNLFVLGAMAELSDDGKAPEDVTYESVLQLAEQIRESLAR